MSSALGIRYCVTDGEWTLQKAMNGRLFVDGCRCCLLQQSMWCGSVPRLRSKTLDVSQKNDLEFTIEKVTKKMKRSWPCSRRLLFFGEIGPQSVELRFDYNRTTETLTNVQRIFQMYVIQYSIILNGCPKVSNFGCCLFGGSPVVVVY